MLTTGLRLGWLPLINAERYCLLLHVLNFIIVIDYFIFIYLFFVGIHIRTKDTFRFWQMHSIRMWNGLCTSTNILSLSLSISIGRSLYFFQEIFAKDISLHLFMAINSKPEIWIRKIKFDKCSTFEMFSM